MSLEVRQGDTNEVTIHIIKCEYKLHQVKILEPILRYIVIISL